MRIALTHNLKLSDSEEEAEFDTPETVEGLAAGLERLGHRVERVEVSGPASRTVARLEAFSPDLCFNTAEGRRGRFREAFYPALFDELGCPYTGSDAWTLAVTLDKQTTKLIVEKHGVRTARSLFVEQNAQLDEQREDLAALKFPVIVKPNFEGSSKGITQDSVLETPDRLRPVVAALLQRFPSGVLIEEFIRGRDITVPFLEAAARASGGVLVPVEYTVDPQVAATRKYAIYDYELKGKLSDAVTVKCPADLPPAVAARITAAARAAAAALDLRDMGRFDFRYGDDGEVYFIEVNALPSLEKGASIYAAAELDGLHFDAVLARIVESACARFGLDPKQRPRPRKLGPLKVGFTYNVKRVVPAADGSADEEAEYDSPKTLQAIREAIASYGHEVVDLEATPELANVLAVTQIDVVFNIAEGIRGRNREAQIPALLELLDIPYTGSDPAALSIALDKALAKRMVRTHGVLTPDWVLMTTGRERIPREVGMPCIVKPVAEGSSKGVHRTSVVHDEAELRERVKEIVGRYDQPALVEEYILGREFTVGLLGERRPRVLPAMEVVFTDPSDTHPVYSFEHKLAESVKVRYECPAKLEPAQARALERAAREVFSALGCRDVARMDFRMDAQGRMYFIECNPLPGLTPGWSDLVLIAKAAGMQYRDVIGELLSFAIRRYKERQRERREAARREALSSSPLADAPPATNGPRNGGAAGVS